MNVFIIIRYGEFGTTEIEGVFATIDLAELALKALTLPSYEYKIEKHDLNHLQNIRLCKLF